MAQTRRPNQAAFVASYLCLMPAPPACLAAKPANHLHSAPPAAPRDRLRLLHLSSSTGNAKLSCAAYANLISICFDSSIASRWKACDRPPHRSAWAPYLSYRYPRMSRPASKTCRFGASMTCGRPLPWHPGGCRRAGPCCLRYHQQL